MTAGCRLCVICFVVDCFFAFHRVFLSLSATRGHDAAQTKSLSSRQDGQSLGTLFLRVSPPAHTAALQQPPWCSISVGTIRFCESTLDVQRDVFYQILSYGVNGVEKLTSEFLRHRLLSPQWAPVASGALSRERGCLAGPDGLWARPGAAAAMLSRTTGGRAEVMI